MTRYKAMPMLRQASPLHKLVALQAKGALFCRIYFEVYFFWRGYYIHIHLFFSAEMVVYGSMTLFVSTIDVFRVTRSWISIPVRGGLKSRHLGSSTSKIRPSYHLLLLANKYSNWRLKHLLWNTLINVYLFLGLIDRQVSPQATDSYESMHDPTLLCWRHHQAWPPFAEHQWRSCHLQKHFGHGGQYFLQREIIKMMWFARW